MARNTFKLIAVFHALLIAALIPIGPSLRGAFASAAAVLPPWCLGLAAAAAIAAGAAYYRRLLQQTPP